MSHSAITLLTTLFDPSDLVLFRPVETWTENGRKRSRVDFGNVCYRPAKLTNLEQTLTRLQVASETERTNLFFGVCPRIGDKGRFDLAWQIRIVRSLWADLDNCSVDQAIERSSSQSIPKPTAIVNSGNGVHLYWLLDQPFLIDDAGDPPPVESEWIVGADGRKKSRRYILDGNDRIYLDRRHHLTKTSPKALLAQDLLAGIAGAIGGDHTTDLTRLLRLPGTLNRKGQRNGHEPVAAELVECDPSRKYSIEVFQRFANSSEATRRQRQIAAMPSPPTDDCSTVVLSDDEIVALACNKPKTGHKFQSLWEGHWNDCFDSAMGINRSTQRNLAHSVELAAVVSKKFATGSHPRIDRSDRLPTCFCVCAPTTELRDSLHAAAVRQHPGTHKQRSSRIQEVTNTELIQ